MAQFLSKILYVLSGRKEQLLSLLAIVILTSTLETIGIGLIGPFLHLASNPELIHRISIFNWVYNQLSLTSSGQFILILGILISLVFSIKSVFYFFARSYIIRFGFNQQKLLISNLLKAYLAVPYTFHLHRNTATLIKNTIIETERFNNQCLLPFLNSISYLVSITFLLLLLARTNILLLVLVSAVLFPTIFFLNLLRGKFKKWGKIKSQSSQEMIRILNHGLGGIKETRVIGCEGYFQQKMEHEAQEFATAAGLFASTQILPRVLIEAVLVIFLIGFISVAQMLPGQNIEDLIASLGVFAIASMRLIPSASQFMQAIGMIQNGSYTLDMLYLDLKEIEKQERPELKQGNSVHLLAANKEFGSPIMDFKRQIDLKHISYRYPGTEELAIKDLTLSLEKGKSIAFIGKSGAGKTTLVDIIIGLLQLEQGDIQVDHVSIYENLRAWQNLIGYIPQSIFLTDDTVERNIAFGVPDYLIDSKKLQWAIEAAQLTELIERLPDGLKTEIGERGIRLSGGQRQRIGIARVLYHEREILVLDEATSALDNETENLVSEAIALLAGQKTMIIIAHRLSTVRHCDQIYVLEKGRIVKSGSYQDVVLSA